MKLPRFIGLVDLGIAAVVLVAIVLPPREMYASAAMKGGDADQFRLALAEARTIAEPASPEKIAELTRQLDDANFKDWAIETAVAGAERAKQSPQRWRALLAASVAYVDHLEVVPALDYATRALEACDAAKDACPSWEQIRMDFYHRHLDAGVKSGIDPRRDPKGFRKAGERGLPTMVRLKSGPAEGGNPPPPTAPK
jgi:hypothetical protein